ncbi:FAD-binding oxidoreductase [Aspergillus stella-maris]|uniref:FAD-binding oxidoreductase n=1 Tax=Aspergillus stella-maris TaxID=1810926 RepID=UPI003CCD76FB
MLPAVPIGLVVTAITAFITPIAASASWSNTSTATGYPPCDALILAGLGSRVLTALDKAYEPRIDSYWALNTRRHPYCLVQPQNAAEVSTAVTTLLNVNDGAGDWHIAVRAGGHNLGSSNNIEQGVTIDLKYLNSTTYDKASNTASLGPGAKWQDVYAELHKYGVVTTGGRDGDVGVGGFLLGGGSTYYMAHQGFGCDSVKNFEVVLVNGTIVNANTNEHSDLWRALKGGGSNFGIVTRYDLDAYPEKHIARGTRSISANYTTRFVNAVSHFTDSQEENKDDALIAILAHVEGQDLLATIEVNIDGVENSTAFNQFAQIPQATPFTQKVQPLYQAALDSTLPGDAWTLQQTLTFKNDKKTLSHAATAHRRFASDLESLIGKESFYSLIFLQPLPSSFADIAAEKGGNMFAETLRDSNNVLWTAGVFVYTNQSGFAIASALMQEMVAELESYAKQTGTDNQLVYLNYAGFAQDPLGSYPEVSVRHMKDIAERYDPEGLFQRRLPGGFKISRVQG